MSIRRARSYTLVAGAIALLACGPLLPAPKSSTSYFVIEERKSKVEAPQLKDRDIDLLLRETQASRFLNSNKIAFSPESSKRGFYQFARWVEPPTRRLTTLLQNRLEELEIFGAVSKLGSTATGDFQLNTELIEFYHDIDSRPGSAVIELNAELINLDKRVVIARQQFHQRLPVESYDVDGAVAGLTLATNRLLDEIIQWLAKSLAKQEAHADLHDETIVGPGQENPEQKNPGQENTVEASAAAPDLESETVED